MITRDIIKRQALELFNICGVLNVTLRQVAKKLDKSYGNITYHYKTKEHVIEELYLDKVEELKAVSARIKAGSNLFKAIVHAPADTFDISVRYIFLFKDFVEIKRNFPAIAERAGKSQLKRKKYLMQSLLVLQHQGIIRKELEPTDLDYLMELSGAMRTFFFLNLSPVQFKKKGLKEKYVDTTNRLLIPYLSAKGKKLYKDLN